MCDAEYSFLLWISVRVGLSDAVFAESALRRLEKKKANLLICRYKEENHRRAATPSQDNGITAYRVKVGRLFLFYGNNVASDENND